MMNSDYKAWRIHFDDIRTEIQRLRTEIKDLKFNSEYCGRTNELKYRLAVLDERRAQIFNRVNRDAKDLRAQIEDNVAAMKEMNSLICKELSETRHLRATRNRANHLHVEELLRQREAAAANEVVIEGFAEAAAQAAAIAVDAAGLAVESYPAAVPEEKGGAE